MTEIFIKKIKNRIAQTAVVNSTIRNMHSAPALAPIRIKLNNLDIEKLIKNIYIKDNYTLYLDELTHDFKKNIPFKNDGWGPSRKCLNLFIRDLFYNSFIREYYNLPSNFDLYNAFLRPLELPLDSYVAKNIIAYNLKDNSKKINLPRWNSVISLKQIDSKAYQNKAIEIAKLENCIPIHLDLIFWKPSKILT